MKKDEDLKDEYYDLLAFEYFHIAQRLIILKNDIEGAKKNFSLSLEFVNKTHSDFQADKLFRKATVAYFDKNIPVLKEIYSLVREVDDNRNIVARMIQGLEARGEIDYHLDYDASPLTK